MQAAQSENTTAPRVRRHSRAAPASLEKAQEGLRPLLGVVGELPIEVAGAAVSSW